MTHLQNYKRIIEDIFGPGTCTFHANSQATNDVVGALASPVNYEFFCRNFEARLRRLKAVYTDHPSSRELLTQVNQVGDPKNWDGAVAELAAFDFFTARRNFLFEPPLLNVSIDPVHSLASKFGLQEANLDVHFQDFNVFTDVKVLKDVVSEILKGIYAEIWPERRPLIHSEYRMDAGYEALQTSRRAVLTLLRDAVQGGQQPTLVDCSKIVDGLRFRLDWTQGVLITESAYSPYRHAEELHRLPLHHAKKFVTNRPFFLTFVIFPWFNNAVPEFRNANKTFYRSLARRVFCQYQQNPTPFSAWYSRFRGSESIHEVAQHLDAILFLEDYSILGEGAENVNVKGFYYENPNGHHPPTRGTMDMYLQDMVHGDYDDFRYDNY